jgi:hypothetical protein
MTRAEAAKALHTSILNYSGAATGACTQVYSPKEPDLILALVNGRIVAAQAVGKGPSEITTVEGVRIGTTASQLVRLLHDRATTRTSDLGAGTTEYDLLVGGGVSESFLVDDTSRAVSSFAYGATAHVVGSVLCR